MTEPERFTEEEVRKMQAYSDHLVLAARTMHEEIEATFGPVATYDEEGKPSYPDYTVGTYLAILSEAINEENLDDIESAFTMILASVAAIKGLPSVNMKKSIIEHGDEIVE